MSTAFKDDLCRMRKKKKKIFGKGQEMHHSDEPHEQQTLGTGFVSPKGTLVCTDCGISLTNTTVRYAVTDAKKPYCRSCWLTRFGKSLIKK
jgi:hypothetical protein